LRKGNKNVLATESLVDIHNPSCLYNIRSPGENVCANNINPKILPMQLCCLDMHVKKIIAKVLNQNVKTNTVPSDPIPFKQKLTLN